MPFWDYKAGYPHPAYDRGGEILDVYVLELDPVEHGFSGLVVELHKIHESGRVFYEVRQSATLTGNRLLVFSTESEELAQAVFDGGASTESILSCGAAGIIG